MPNNSSTRIPVPNAAIVPVEGPTTRAGAAYPGGVIPSEAAFRPTRDLSSNDDLAGRDAQERFLGPRGPRNDSADGESRNGNRSSASVSASASPANPYGPNNETLPERLQEALRRLVQQYSTESESTRRQEIRRIKQAHQFWRGLQYLWWDERDQNWHLPFEQKIMDNSSIEDLPRYEFVTNIYQAFGLSLIAVLSQDVPRVRFFPSSAQAEEDVAAAKAATEVSALVERNNRIGNLIVDEAFHLWTGGKVGAYVRFVVDGQRFGFHPETEIGLREVRVGGDTYVCPDCGAETPSPVGAQHAAPDGAQAPSSDATARGLASPRSNAGRSVLRPYEETTSSAVPPADIAGPGSARASSSSNDARGAGNAPPPSDDDILRGDTVSARPGDPFGVRRLDAAFSSARLDSRPETESENAQRFDTQDVASAGSGVVKPTPQTAASSRRCDQCGALLTEEDYVAAETITVPGATTRLRVPNGQEVVTICGGLELKTPPWANEMHEYPYVQWNMEVHMARLRAAYPHAAEKIGAPVATSMQEYERLARLAQSQGGPLTEGGDYNMNLITFQRTWLRPWAFFALDDKSLRDELLQLFPDGAYIALAGDVYCESRNENMDDHWRVLHAIPGDGSAGRPALGDVMISVQERFNTLSNLQIESYEYGIPPIYADSEVLDFDALQSQTAEPGSHYPAHAKAGQSLAAGFFQPEPAQVPPDLAEHAANLMGPIAQFLTGAFPALFGGAMANNDTAAGYSMARDQALGRIGLVWRRMKFFHADMMLLAVDCFRQNRPNDVEVTLLGAGAAFESKWIRLADLKGNLFSYPETDEQYPTLWSQQRAVLLQLMSNPDPQLQAVLAHPDNLALIKRLIGLEELVVPDDESRTKQYREIVQLLTEAPLVVRSDGSSEFASGENHAPGAPSLAASAKGGSSLVGARPFSGKGAVPGANARHDATHSPGAPPPAGVIPSEARNLSSNERIAGADPQERSLGPEGPRDDNAAVSAPVVELTLPSLMPDEFADNHAIELEVCMRWFSSDAGQVAKIENPTGYANVRAHALFHRDYLRKQQAQAAQQAQLTTPPRRPS